MASGVVALMIAAACANLSGPQKDACQKGLEAGGKQSGAEQIIYSTQKKIENNAKEAVQSFLGEEGMGVAGGTIFLTKTVINKSVKFSLPTLGICDKVTNQVGPDKYSLLMEWHF